MHRLIEDAIVIHKNEETILKELVKDKYGSEQVEIIDKYLEEKLFRLEWEAADITTYYDGWLPEKEILKAILVETGVSCDSELLRYCMSNLGVVPVPMEIGGSEYQYQVFRNFPVLLRDQRIGFFIELKEILQEGEKVCPSNILY